MRGVRAELRVASAAEEVPDRVALVDRDGPISYAGLAERVKGAAAALLERGVRPCDASMRVAFPGEGTVDAVIVLLALIELGVPAVPVHPKLSPWECRDLLDRLVPVRTLDAADLRTMARGRGRVQSLPEPDPESPLAVVPTSGTSGRSRGVVLSRRAFAAAAEASARNLGWRDEDRWLLGLSLSHVGGLTIPLRTLLGRRATVVGPPGPFAPDAIVDAIERHRVTILSLVPTMLARLLDEFPDWTPPAHLRAVLLGGAGASDALLERADARGVPVLGTYGLTETCGQVTTQHPGTPPGLQQGAGPPLPGMDVRCVEGEIQVRGPSLASGYAGTPERIPVTEDGFLRTGDAGRLDPEGRLHVLGRLDDRIVTGGENVDPLEVERVLEGVPGVRAACVFGLPDATWGQVVAAALVPDGDRPGLARLEAELRARLAPHRRPRRVAFVSDLDRTPSGKVDRRAVRARWESCVRPLSG